MSSGKVKSNPWKNGFYRMKSIPSMIFIVDGKKVSCEYVCGKPSNHENDPNCHGSFKFGDFGKANPEVAKAAGKENYNIEITLWNGVFPPKGIVSDDGTKISFWGMENAVDSLDWVTEESIKAYRESGDPADAPPSHYKVQPENQGKFLFISGPPGTEECGLLLSKKHGYVYYKGDNFWGNLNPYLPPDSDGSGATQNFLKGVPQDRLDAAASAEDEFNAMMDGKGNQEKLCNLYSMMAKDITKERKRLGGNWAVSNAVPTRKLRDHLRAKLGSKLIFVVIDMTKADYEAMVKKKHGEEAGTIIGYLLKAYKVYEPARKDEPNTLDVKVTREMNQDDVADQIVSMLKKK